MTNTRKTINTTNTNDRVRAVRKSKTLKLLLCLSAVAFLAPGARALPEYLKIYAADPASRPELRTRCSVCHVNPAGGGPRNEFGVAFAQAGKKITPDLRQRFASLFV